MTDQPAQEGVSPAALSIQPLEAAKERAISPRLPPALTAAGGVLIAVGGVGTWVRATILPTGGGTMEQVAVVTGRSGSGGWILLALGLACSLAAFAWRSGAPQVRALAPGVSALVVIFASVRLALIDGRAERMAEEAASTTGIDIYHAGYGWGAWLLLAGVVLLALGLLAGGLREIDLRRGG